MEQVPPRCWGGQEAATPARKSEGTVTSLRWSVLPQDAERLCVQELLRSPSSSCQDRGVCREKNREMEQLLRWARGKQTHRLLDRGSGLCSLICSTTSSTLSARYPSRLLHPTPSFPVTFLLMSQQGRPALSSLRLLHMADRPSSRCSPTVSSSIAPRVPTSSKEHRLRDPLASSILVPSMCPAQAQAPGNLMKASY